TPILPVCHLQSHFAVLHLEGVPTKFPVLGLLLPEGIRPFTSYMSLVEWNW
ncbi:UGMP domain protein, partial [Leptospira kirschneri str. H1]